MRKVVLWATVIIFILVVGFFYTLAFAPDLVLQQDSPNFYGRVVSISGGVARVDLWAVMGNEGRLCGQNAQVVSPSLVNGSMVYFHFAHWFWGGDPFQIVDGTGTRATDLALAQGSSCFRPPNV